MLRLLVPLVLALSLAGCGPAAKLGDLVSAVTTPITNPVSTTDIYRVKNVYAATLELAVKYREYCWSKPYEALMADPVGSRLCQSRRQVVRSIQTAQVKAKVAINRADAFVRNNPTFTATTAISEAWTAVREFQNAVPGVN
jgi:hypothetical protein